MTRFMPEGDGPRMTRFIRPEGDGRYGVFIDGTQDWYRCATLRTEDGGFRAIFRDCDPGDLGVFGTLQEAGEAVAAARTEEGRILADQIAYERANGWSTE